MSRRVICAKRNRGALILLMSVAMIASSRFPVQAQDTSITGVVRSAAGEPVAGALVKVRSEALGLGFMVVSQTQGRYSTPHLLPGLYSIRSRVLEALNRVSLEGQSRSRAASRGRWIWY
ncbi:MAG: hypothetical protein A3H28_09845 [Acidobacteria bacterium RIFCSPLOWO2_02_FULL_61_28]|nr:MAG: hypothetical protein A3H28_09845 [Acidobacteria bacterium RIFCSPLOWO2_02_FULL_61_28]